MSKPKQIRRIKFFISRICKKKFVVWSASGITHIFASVVDIGDEAKQNALFQYRRNAKF